MTAANLSLLNAVTLVVVGGLGFLLPEKASLTALIPVVAGVLIGACNPGLRKHDKVIAHVAVGLTLLILLGLVMPLRGAIGREDTAAIGRVLLMIVTCVAALFAMVKSFVDARRGRDEPAV